MSNSDLKLFYVFANTFEKSGGVYRVKVGDTSTDRPVIAISPDEARVFHLERLKEEGYQNIEVVDVEDWNAVNGLDGKYLISIEYL